MSVAQYDEEPFPYQVEAYHELARGQWVEVRRNDVQVAIGARGVVLKKVAETGNYQVAVEVEGQDQKRIVALCPDQVRPVDAPLPEPEPKKPASKWTEEKRAAQSEKLQAYWARRRAAKENPEAAAANVDAQLAEVTRKLEEQTAEILGAPRRKLKDAPVEIPEPEPFDEEPDAELDQEQVAAIRHVMEYRDRFVAPAPRLVEVTWTQRAADAIRPVLAEAATGGANPTELALLVETISYLEDGGRP